MKKLLSLVLTLALCASFVFALSSCTEEDAKEIFENLNKEEWAEALSAPNFENVTISYEYTQEGALTKQTAKFTKDGVFRSAKSFDADGKEVGSFDMFFENEEADQQRELFLQVFLAIVGDRDNFKYDEATKLYTAENAEARVDYEEQNAYVIEKMKDGKLEFGSDGNVKRFVCNLTESIYHNNELGNSANLDVEWTFSAYGTTTITDAEKANASNK